MASDLVMGSLTRKERSLRPTAPRQVRRRQVRTARSLTSVSHEPREQTDDGSGQKTEHDPADRTDHELLTAFLAADRVVEDEERAAKNKAQDSERDQQALGPAGDVAKRLVNRVRCEDRLIGCNECDYNEHDSTNQTLTHE